MNNVILVKGYAKNIIQNLVKNSFNYVVKSKMKAFKVDDIPKYITPDFISNTIIKFDDNYYFNKNISTLFSLLSETLCKYIVIEINFNLDINKFFKLIEYINNNNIHQVQFIFNYQEKLISDEFVTSIYNTNRISTIVVFNSPFEKNLENYLFFFKQKKQINFNKKITEFVSNKFLFRESFYQNTYFNKKIFFDSNGNIKNAPECDEIFGNIKEINNPEELKKIISTPEFQKYWDVNKDIQDVCKDCEFRYMCVDNKIPYQRTENEWYHKMECNYNPYIAKWEGEEGYKTLAECGVFSDENGFSIDHEKIAAINNELWGED